METISPSSTVPSMHEHLHRHHNTGQCYFPNSKQPGIVGLNHRTLFSRQYFISYMWCDSVCIFTKESLKTHSSDTTVRIYLGEWWTLMRKMAFRWSTENTVNCVSMGGQDVQPATLMHVSAATRVLVHEFSWSISRGTEQVCWVASWCHPESQTRNADVE